MTGCEWCEREASTRLCMVRTTDGSLDGPFDVCAECERSTDTFPYADFADGEAVDDRAG